MKVHPRINARHPEITDADVLHAWKNCIRSVPRVDKDPIEFVSVGADSKGRIIEMVSALLLDGSWIIYLAMTPPAKKTLKELGLASERR